MPEQVEDGTGLVDATTYAASADVEAYLEEANPGALVAWLAITDEARVGAVNRLSEWLDGRYYWKSVLLVDDPPQALQLPRERFYYSRRWWEPAQQVTRAAGAVLRAVALDLEEPVDRHVNPGATLEQKGIGRGAITRRFRKDWKPERRYRSIDRYLRGLYTAPSAHVPLVAGG